MKTIYRVKTAALMALTSIVLSGAAHANPGSNKKLVQRAMTELFQHRDTTAVQRYWGEPYTQHNPAVPNGAAGLVPLVKSLPADFSYEPGMIVAEGDLVMLHGRYNGFGPKPLVVVDIFRVKSGKIVEHWDVMQEDVPASKTKSGNPMFSPRE